VKVGAKITIVILLALGLVGFGAWLEKTSAAGGQAKQATAVVKQSKANVVIAVAESTRIETEVAAADANVVSIKEAVIKRGVTLQPKKATHDRDTATAAVPNGLFCPDPDPAHYVLDAGTVGMLNAAREGRSLGAAGSSDEAQSAPSTVEVIDLVTNDLDIVRMYHDLAKRHDELVGAVEKHLEDQAR
jgi:hypothetical protein